MSPTTDGADGVYVVVASESTEAPRDLVSGFVELGYVTLERPLDAELRGLFDSFTPDVLVLVVRGDAHEAPVTVRAYTSTVDSIVVTLFQREPPPDVVAACLNAGADFCYSTADGMDMVVASIEAAIRRSRGMRETSSASPSEETIEIGDIVVDTARFAVFKDGEPVALTPMEYRIVAFLASNANTVCATGSIARHVYADATRPITAPEMIKTYIRRIRSKLESDPDQPRSLITVRGFGYMLSTENKERVHNRAG